ncbi:MAG: hypothetical protein RL701_7015 [Pseudomonadota bacterium]|jgi:fumarate reductase subunit D
MLYCPFCRELFDVDAQQRPKARCPDHDLELVTLRELARYSELSAADDQPLALWSPKRARGWLALGALTTLIAFLCPFGSLVGDTELSNTLFMLARGQAVRLWVVPTAAFALFLMLHRRRTPVALRGARLAALFVSVLPSVVVFMTWRGARAAAHALADRTVSHIEFQLGSGAWLVWGSGILLTFASLRLGVHKRPLVRST